MWESMLFFAPIQLLLFKLTLGSIAHQQASLKYHTNEKTNLLIRELFTF